METPGEALFFWLTLRGNGRNLPLFFSFFSLASILLYPGYLVVVAAAVTTASKILREAKLPLQSEDLWVQEDKVNPHHFFLPLCSSYLAQCGRTKCPAEQVMKAPASWQEDHGVLGRSQRGRGLRKLY